MSKVKSIFGAYSESLQVMIDTSLQKFYNPWFLPKVPFGTPSTQLNFTTIIGRARIEAAASIIARGSAAPLRVRATLEKISGEVPAIAEKFSMKESDYRDYLALQAMPVDDAVKKAQLLNLMFDDVRNAGNSVMKRLDYMVLEALYTGAISLNTTNNPDGTVLNNAIDLFMPANNKTTVSTSWETSASATPIADIQAVVTYQQTRGVKLAKILMSPVLFQRMVKTTEVKSALSTWLGMKGNSIFPTLDNVNAFLQAQMYPIIEIVDVPIGVEKDGVVSVLRPFGDDNATFIPDGAIGEVKHALAMEQLRPVEGVAYATFNNALISKWAENEPFAEWTKAEFNAFPSLDAIDQIHILDTKP
jgi:hypothetical protein